MVISCCKTRKKCIAACSLVFMLIWCFTIAAHLEVNRCIQDRYKVYLFLSLVLTATFILGLIVGLMLAVKFYDVVLQGKIRQQTGFD